MDASRRSPLPKAPDNYHVIKEDREEIEFGSIGVRFDGWHWDIDSIDQMREEVAEGSGTD
jgi:hypothetical protein